MHLHTNFSDGTASPEEIMKKARMMGIGVSITDHNEIGGYEKAFEEKEKGNFIIPGIEVKSKEMVDVLFYFYSGRDLGCFFSEEIKRKTRRFMHSTLTTIPLKELIAFSSSYRCLTSAAHPFGYSLRLGSGNIFSKHKHILKECNAFEAVNGGNSRKQNLKAVNYIAENEKAFTAGSDAHTLQSMGNVVCCSKAESVQGFLKSIGKKENIAIGREAYLGKVGEYGRYAATKIKEIFKK